MKVTNVSGEARYLPAAGVDVDNGATIEVDDDLAASLLDQPANWAAADLSEED